MDETTRLSRRTINTSDIIGQGHFSDTFGRAATVRRTGNGRFTGRKRFRVLPRGVNGSVEKRTGTDFLDQYWHAVAGERFSSYRTISVTFEFLAGSISFGPTNTRRKHGPFPAACRRFSNVLFPNVSRVFRDGHSRPNCCTTVITP